MTARIALLVLALLPVCSGILPEIMDSGISHILGDDDTQGQTEPEHPLVGVEQPPEEDGDHQVGFFFYMTQHYSTADIKF